jgi:hypothetical protein
MAGEPIVATWVHPQGNGADAGAAALGAAPAHAVDQAASLVVRP